MTVKPEEIMKSKQQGFTLVEIAIVLVIIGLLMTGVLKGQELVTQARAKNIANDLNSVAAAVYTYQDRYKALPGDDNGAQGRWGLSAGQNGDRNGLLSTSNANGADETLLFWLHLRRAGVITGDASSSAAPLNAVNGTTIAMMDAAGFSGLVLCTNALPGRIAETVDNQFDDGKPNAGTVHATVANTGTSNADLAQTTQTAYVDDNATYYRICKQL
jgi:prepilin-type N-terminal cleavage/methylation domain-containing protein